MCVRQSGGHTHILLNDGRRVQIHGERYSYFGWFLVILVTAGIIRKDDKILIAQRKKKTLRSYALQGKWEFPGGKLEENESPEEGLRRELQEELNIDVKVGKFFTESIHSYPNLKVDILAYTVEYVKGSLKLTSHSQVKWVKISELSEYEFVEADRPIVKKLLETG